MKRNPFLLLLVLYGLGCSHASTPGASTDAQAMKPPAQSDLEKKLNAMTPADRAAYVQAHPDELKQAYGQVGH